MLFLILDKQCPEVKVNRKFGNDLAGTDVTKALADAIDLPLSNFNEIFNNIKNRLNSKIEKPEFALNFMPEWTPEPHPARIGKNQKINYESEETSTEEISGDEIQAENDKKVGKCKNIINNIKK